LPWHCDRCSRSRIVQNISNPLERVKGISLFIPKVEDGKA